MRVLAGAGRSSSLLLQWFNLEHCRCWQDGRPVWPELSDHPAPSSLWCVTQFMSSVSIWLTVSIWCGPEMDYKIWLQISWKWKPVVSLFLLKLVCFKWIQFWGRWRGAVICPCHSHQCSLTIWSNYCNYINFTINVFHRNWYRCHWCMPGWTVFGGLWKKWNSSFDICSTKENTSYQGMFIFYYILLFSYFYISHWCQISCTIL